MTKKYGVFPFSMIGKYFIKDSIKIYQSLSEAIKLKEILNVTTKENYVIEDLHYCED